MLGYIHMEELLSVEKCEDEPSRDPKYRHCFEVNTQGRGYLFSAETEGELGEWLDTFQKIVSSDAADNLVSDVQWCLLVCWSVLDLRKYQSCYVTYV